MRCLALFLAGFIFIPSTLASNHLEIKFRKVKTLDGTEVTCPKKMKSKRNDYERYCTEGGLAQADAICIENANEDVVFVGRGKKSKAKKFKIEAKAPDTLICDKTGYTHRKKCTVTDANNDNVIKYTISTRTCSFDPRIIISNQVLRVTSN